MDDLLKHISAIVTDDPLTSLPMGSEISFTDRAFPPYEHDYSGNIENWDFFDGTVLQICLRTRDTLSHVGSAVMVAPGIAITAKHVIDEGMTSASAGKASFMVLAIRRDGMQIWKIDQITRNEDDVAVISIRSASAAPPDLNYRVVPCTTRTPLAGERAMIVGFRGEENAVGSDKGVLSKTNVRIAVGEITDVFPTGRDRIINPFPCFAVKGRAIGGMSGGPVFDEYGHLIGILSTSFDHEDGPAYASMLHAAMTWPVRSEWPNGMYDGRQSLISLSLAGVAPIMRPEAIQIDPETGDTVYSEWH